ncbi:DNA-binding transcriptional regulator, GntR family [Duganella sp. CF402]|uniref:GntR family transcriptional regulator n=1 Tax=unclassified Duganella TaxID=2636909 RepID=UPI0008C7A7DF|nr:MULTISPECIES: GntR family transcriptional regulator [unclassified Duganella]RZT08221.1 DNA-binding GntR family transcriptional regulator [Duganella sp. BK701]SEM01685.1 DNA-binding transcriptional regulator, GntR family [Duganella sp. CF402]
MSLGPFQTPFRLDRSRNAAAQVFDHLRELITTLELKPGESLQRNDLSDYYGLSSTPVRDALTKLSDERLVDIYPQQATVVRAIDLHSAKQAQFLRLSLELEIVAQLAQQVTPQLVATLGNFISQQEFALSQGDYETFVKADMAFHRQMFAAANVEELWRWVRQQSGNLDRLRRLHLPIEGKATRVLADHSGILAAIDAGDSDQAMSKVRQHLSGTLSQLDAIRKKYPDYLLG